MDYKANYSFIERDFEEVAGGKYDDNGFYTTPNGSKIRYIFIIRLLGSGLSLL